MRLAQFILANVGPILAEWDVFAGSLTPGATMTKTALRDDAESILLACARSMQADQNLAQQASKSQGHGGADNIESGRLDNASHLHGKERVDSAFDIIEVVSEYRALRASVLRLWRESLPQPDIEDIDDITRFNESIDQSLAQAVRSYTDRVNRSRQLFLAMLGHDLRNPLNCIRMGARLASKTNGEEKSNEALSMIATQTEVMETLISDLLEFASTKLGGIIPLNRKPLDLRTLCRVVVDEYHVTHPQRTLHFDAHGDLAGIWDEARIRQIVTNLLDNALQHGAPEGPVELSAASAGLTVVLSVHNVGAPIPPKTLPTIFDPMVRHATAESALQQTPSGVGLGLYIVREILKAKGGEIAVTSTAQQGTTFTVSIPRQPTVGRDKPPNRRKS